MGRAGVGPSGLGPNQSPGPWYEPPGPTWPVPGHGAVQREGSTNSTTDNVLRPNRIIALLGSRLRNPRGGSPKQIFP